MKVKVVYDNIKDKELIEMINFNTPFFVEYIDTRTRNGLKEGRKVKNEYGAKENPFVLVLDNEDNYVSCFWTDGTGNAVQQFVNLYK